MFLKCRRADLSQLSSTIEDLAVSLDLNLQPIELSRKKGILLDPLTTVFQKFCSISFQYPLRYSISDQFLRFWTIFIIYFSFRSFQSKRRRCLIFYWKQYFLFKSYLLQNFLQAFVLFDRLFLISKILSCFAMILKIFCPIMGKLIPYKEQNLHQRKGG